MTDETYVAKVLLCRLHSIVSGLFVSQFFFIINSVMFATILFRNFTADLGRFFLFRCFERQWSFFSGVNHSSEWFGTNFHSKSSHFPMQDTPTALCMHNIMFVYVRGTDDSLFCLFSPSLTHSLNPNSSNT